MNIDFSEAFQSLTGMVNGFIERLPYLAVAFLVFLLFCWVAKGIRVLARNLTGRYRKHQNLGLVMGRLAQGIVIFLGVMVALVIALPNFQPGQLIQLLGISSVAIGFAFKDIFQNFLAGILLLVNEPFKIGDQIRVASYEGTVEDIQTRATYIQTFDGRRIVIPNGQLFNESVTVTTAYARRRFEYDFGIGYSDDVEKAKELILEVMRQEPGVLDEPEPDVLVDQLAESTVNLKARWWVSRDRKSDNLQIRDNVLASVKRVLTDNHIDLPYPIQTFLMQDVSGDPEAVQTGDVRGATGSSGQGGAPAKRGNGGIHLSNGARA